MFNTLKYTKKLEEAGIVREHAEAHVQIIAEIVEADLATKADIKELKDELIKFEYRIIFRLTTILVVTTTTLAAILGGIYKFL